MQTAAAFLSHMGMFLDTPREVALTRPQAALPIGCFCPELLGGSWYSQDVFSSSVGLPSDSIPVSSGRGLQASRDAEVKRQEKTGEV